MSKRILAKIVHMHLGCPALGGKQSLQGGKANTLVVTPEGILAISTTSKRAILLPYSNIVDMELFFEQESVQDLLDDVKPKLVKAKA